MYYMQKFFKLFSRNNFNFKCFIFLLFYSIAIHSLLFEGRWYIIYKTSLYSQISQLHQKFGILTDTEDNVF